MWVWRAAGVLPYGGHLENGVVTSIPELGFIWKKIAKKLISTDYGRYGCQYSPKKSKDG